MVVFFALLGLFLGLGSGSKIFFGLTNVDYYFWFSKYSSIFLFLIQQLLGPFFTFRALWGHFWSRGQVQILFYTINFGFGSTVLSFILIQPKRPFLGLLGLFFGLGSCSKLFQPDYQLSTINYQPDYQLSTLVSKV